ncbi:long-chain acyl-CoA synthetase [Salinihabitans flavidus]|uniref:Long-chain acyl-CoA synthetase n=1 Tax=Salinihabitans flavidus TaxID=569882 RepID=A0A1H8P855_9RHOB|nr:long-chain fatty acid--CoA ligase [Salinihabitans flavidus]SEO37951.1 long-chain acyl-CoA synthetase [Salinihabitans flavidus]
MSYDSSQFAAKGFRTNVQVIRDHAASDPDRVAMRQKEFGIWHELTWAGVEEIMQALAAGLMEVGMQAGEHVGILSENRREWVLAQFGINSAAGVVVGMYPTSPAAEIDHLVNASDTSILFIEDQEQFDKIVDLEGRVPRLRQLIVFDPKGTAKSDLLNLMSFDDLLELGRARIAREGTGAVEARIEAVAPDDTAIMVFTSGSTGLPKAAEISFHNLWVAGCYAAQFFAEFRPGTNILSYLPLCHIAEQNVTVTNALVGQMVMNFGESLRTIGIDLRDVAPEIFFGVPRIWEKMQADIMVQAETAGPLRRGLTLRALRGARARGARRRDRWSMADRLANAVWDLLIYRHVRAYTGLGRVRFAISAAAPVSGELLAFLRGIGINIREAWGMSETTGAATLQPDWGNCDGRVGFFVEGMEHRIAEDGELLVKGGIVFKGYYKNPEATAEAITDGWLHTGDVAEEAPDGSISIVDRKKDIMINAAGKNLSPSMIENVIKASPYIKECIVIADARKYVSALVQIDMATVRLWAESQKIGYTTFRSLAENPKVKELIESEVERLNAELARVEQVKRVYLLPKELDHDDGEVTATMKVRRAKIFDFYGEEIESLYA